MTQPVRTIEAQPDTRLEQLLAQYDLAKAEADKAAEALKAITDGIKSELANAAPGAESVIATSPDLAAPLRMTAVTSWRIDTKKMKAEAPATYVRYARQSTSWRLAAVSS
jgi:predicted phage-related endonuclease